MYYPDKKMSLRQSFVYKIGVYTYRVPSLIDKSSAKIPRGET